MAKLSKREKAVQGKVDRSKNYAVVDALSLAKEFATAKFDESIDVAVSLGIDPRKSDQLVRGSVVLPAGTGTIKIEQVDIDLRRIIVTVSWTERGTPRNVVVGTLVANL